jgi:hypothetical protein
MIRGFCYAVESVGKAIPAICEHLKKHATVEIFDRSTLTGYFAKLKMPEAPIAELTDAEFRKLYLIHKTPEPADIVLRPWRACEYAGVHLGERKL